MAEETKKTVLEVKIEAAEAAKTIGDLRKSLKGLIDQQATVAQGSAEWKKLTKAINETEGKIGDLQDSFATLKGSGIERATASLNFLKEGFLKLDFGLLKTGLAGLRTALASTGILLLVQGVTYLVDNFDELTKGSGGLAKALKFVGDIVGKVINFFTDFLKLTSETERAYKRQAEGIKQLAELSNQALAKTTAEYDRQIAVVKANGKSTVEIEKAKQQAIIDTNTEIINQLIAYKKSGGQLSEDQIKQLRTSTEAIKNAHNASTVAELEENKKKADDYKKKLEEKKEANKKHLEEQREADKKYLNEIETYKISQIKDDVDRLDEEAQFRRKNRDNEIKESKASAEVKKQALINSENIYQNELNKILKDYKDKQLKDEEDFLKKQHKKENEDLKALGELNLITYKDNYKMLWLAKQNNLEIQKNIELENTELTESQKALIIAKYEDQNAELKKAKNKQTHDTILKFTEESLKDAQAISEVFFQIENNKLNLHAEEKKKNELLKNKELTEAQKNEINNRYDDQVRKADALAKRQFKINKQFALASAVIDGYKSVSSTFAATPGGIVIKSIAAGLAGVFAAAQVAKIASSQYESKFDTSGSSASEPSDKMSTEKPPTITQPLSQQPTTPGTNFDAQGNVIGGSPMKAYVVETEITNKQTTVNRLQSQAEFG